MLSQDDIVDNMIILLYRTAIDTIAVLYPQISIKN